MTYLYTYIALTIMCSLVYVVSAGYLNKHRAAKWGFVLAPVTFMLSTAGIIYLLFSWSGEAFGQVSNMLQTLYMMINKV